MVTDSSERILVVAPHPDDPEMGAGGTIGRWAMEGRQVYYAMCTNGDKGSSDPEMTSERLARIRREEQLAAARVLGVKEVIFLDYPDGGLEDTPQFRGDVVRLIRQLKPYRVLTCDPHREYMYHRDHRITGRVVMDAVFPYARDRLSYPEHEKMGLAPHKVAEVYFWTAPRPNYLVDVTGTFDRKLKAVLCHQSQFKDRVGMEERLRERAQMFGKEKGIPLAEAFYRLEIPR
ncbi:MAG: PIG-L family deacetylase [Chloroflexi bacterium]|nr:PIG-L family deacetylase [Chloroflexota bacterium]